MVLKCFAMTIGLKEHISIPHALHLCWAISRRFGPNIEKESACYIVCCCKVCFHCHPYKITHSIECFELYRRSRQFGGGGWPRFWKCWRLCRRADAYNGGNHLQFHRKHGKTCGHAHLCIYWFGIMMACDRSAGIRRRPLLRIWSWKVTKSSTLITQPESRGCLSDLSNSLVGYY